MKFYIQHDIEKALEMGNELLESKEFTDNDLPDKDKADLKFHLGTAYALHGSDLDSAL